MRRRVSSRLQEYPFLSKISFCSHAAEAILFVDLKKTAKHDVIIPDYSKYSGIGIASQSNGCSGLFLLFLFRNSVNRTHPKKENIKTQRPLACKHQRQSHFEEGYEQPSLSAKVAGKKETAALTPVDNSKFGSNCHSLFRKKYSGKSSGGATNRRSDSGSYRQFSSVN